MNTLSYKTRSVSKEDEPKNWYVVDAENKTVGRLATSIASVLRGKHKPSFTPHSDTGDYVVVLNADKVVFTGNKLAAKTYIRYSGYAGGQKSRTAQELFDKKPTEVLEKAVRGMLPKTKLGRAQIKKLFLYTGTEHPHKAQKPQPFKF